MISSRIFPGPIPPRKISAQFVFRISSPSSWTPTAASMSWAEQTQQLHTSNLPLTRTTPSPASLHSPAQGASLTSLTPANSLPCRLQHPSPCCRREPRRQQQQQPRPFGKQPPRQQQQPRPFGKRTPRHRRQLRTAVGPLANQVGVWKPHAPSAPWTACGAMTPMSPRRSLLPRHGLTLQQARLGGQRPDHHPSFPLRNLLPSGRSHWEGLSTCFRQTSPTRWLSRQPEA